MAIVEFASRQVKAEGGALDRETRFRRGAFRLIGGAGEDVGDIGDPSVGSGAFLDGVADPVEDVVRSEDVGPGATTA